MQEGAPSSPRSALVEAMSTLVGTNMFADVTFLVDAQRVPAHRAVLASRSVFFRKLFEENSDAVIPLEGIRYAIFMAVLRYLYTARIEVDPRMALEMIVAAEKFGLTDMKALCFGKIEQTFDDTNVCEILSLADQYGAEGLKTSCLKYIHENFTRIARQPSFKSLNKSIIVEILRSRR